MKIYKVFAALLAVCFAAAMPAAAFAADALSSAAHLAGGLSTEGMIAAVIGMALMGSIETKTPAELAAEVKGDFERSLDKVREIAESALGKAEGGERLSRDVKEQADDALTTMNELKARFEDLEQKLARENHRGEDGLTAGERFTGDEGFKAFAGQTRPRGRVVVEVKDISSLTTDADGSVGTLIQPTRSSPIKLPERRMTIRALLAPGQTSSNAIEYDKEKGFTNAAAVVADGAAKPQSSIQWEEATAPVRTIAHWMRTNVQTLADIPALRSMIDGKLRYGLAYAEEYELLTGDGTGQHLSGLITEATAYAAPGSLVAENMVDDLRYAILQVALAEYPANGIVLNPIDMAYIETLKDNEGRYLFGNPQGEMQPRLWRLPVVETQAMTVDKFLVGAFDLAAQIFDRQDATVEVSTEDQDNFIKNKVTIRAEERLALAIYRPEALVYGDLGRV